ncbi:MAG: hypothetical protein B7C24_15365 [Bacteroidetes bacterium 4572_77]|nr:MAG: hypothetical protein B7C24_15365 [Bacteroidetes bacterium 4572_77]
MDFEKETIKVLQMACRDDDLFTFKKGLRFLFEDIYGYHGVGFSYVLEEGVIIQETNGDLEWLQIGLSNRTTAKEIWDVIKCKLRQT